MADSVKIRITGDDKEFKNMLSGLGNGVKAAFKGISVVTGAVSAAWSAVGVKAVQYNADMETLKTSFEVMTGSAEKAEETVARLKKMGAETPFETTDLVKTTQLLMQYGFTADDALDKMQMLGDISQGNADAMTSIATGYAQMSSAGKVNLQDIKQMINGGFNPLQEISERTGESMDSLYDRVSKGTISIDEITASMQAATSEGGKFYQSMAKQSQTLNGQISTLKDNAKELAGAIFAPISESARTSILPEAIGMVNELQTAFEQGGTDGMVKAINGMIPKLTVKAVDAAKKILTGVSGRLPEIAKGLMNSVPKLLEAGGDIMTSLSDSAFKIAGNVAEDLVRRLPELMPIILKGAGNFAISVAEGLVGVIGGVAEGLDDILKDAGLKQKTLEDVIGDMIDGIPDYDIPLNADAHIETEVTTDDYQTKIDSAISDIESALEGVPELSEDQKAAIKKAVLAGTGADLIGPALADAGVPEGRAAEIAQTVTDAAAEIKTAVDTYGADSAEAKAVMDAADAAIEEACAGLGLDPGTVGGLKKAARSDRDALTFSLNMYKLQPGVVDTIVAGYDAAGGRLSAKLSGMFTDIGSALTNGIPDENDPALAAALEQLTAYYDTALGQIDAWEQEELQKIEDSGLSGGDYQAAVQAVIDEANSMRDAVKGIQEDTNGFVDSMAGKSTSYVQEHLNELEEIAQRAGTISAEIDMLSDKAFASGGDLNRRAVQQGLVTDEEGQLAAISYTSEELARALEDAQTKSTAALEQAEQDFAGDAKGYAQRRAEIMDELAAYQAEANDKYEAEMQKIVDGMLKSDSDMYALLGDAQTDIDLKSKAKQLYDGMINAYKDAGKDSGSVLDELLGNIGVTEPDFAAIAANLNMDGPALREALIREIETSMSGNVTGDSPFAGMLSRYFEGAQFDLASVFKTTEIDTSGIENIFDNALQKGLLAGNWTNTGAALSGAIETAAEQAVSAAENAGADTAAAFDVGDKTSKSGKNAGQGFYDGLRSKSDSIIKLAKSIASQVTSVIQEALDEHSPSRKAYKLGAFFGEGFEGGIADSMNQAVRTAQSIAGSMNLSPNAVYRATGIRMNDDVFRNLANLENQREIALYIGGEKMASTLAPYNNGAINSFVRDINLGYGRG